MMDQQNMGGIEGSGLNTSGEGKKGGVSGYGGGAMRMLEAAKDGTKGMDEDAIMAAIWAGIVTYWVLCGIRCFYTYVIMKWWKEGIWIKQDRDAQTGAQDAHPCRQPNGKYTNY